MRNPFVVGLSALLVLTVFYEFLRTTISPNGMGFISRSVTFMLGLCGVRAAAKHLSRYGTITQGTN
jgi:hypothetical protein